MSASDATTVAVQRTHEPAGRARAFVVRDLARPKRTRSRDSHKKHAEREIDRLLDALRSVVAARKRLAQGDATSAALAELTATDVRLRARLASVVLRHNGEAADGARLANEPAETPQ